MPEKLLIIQNKRKALYDKGLLKVRCINCWGEKLKYGCNTQPWNL